jgi:hypothetical protein
MSSEAIALGGSAAATAWASVSEFLPALPKTFVGVVLGAIATWSSIKAWQAKRREQGKDED